MLHRQTSSLIWAIKILAASSFSAHNKIAIGNASAQHRHRQGGCVHVSPAVAPPPPDASGTAFDSAFFVCCLFLWVFSGFCVQAK